MIRTSDGHNHERNIPGKRTAPTWQVGWRISQYQSPVAVSEKFHGAIGQLERLPANVNGGNCGHCVPENSEHQDDGFENDVTRWSWRGFAKGDVFRYSSRGTSYRTLVSSPRQPPLKELKLDNHRL